MVRQLLNESLKEENRQVAVEEEKKERRFDSLALLNFLSNTSSQICGELLNKKLSVRKVMEEIRMVLLGKN